MRLEFLFPLTMKCCLKNIFSFSVWQVLLFLIVFVHCSPAEPNENDVERVKRSFLELRFNAAFASSLQGKEDADLFQISCQLNRVHCRQVLKMLREKDPAFFKKLNIVQEINAD